MMMLIETVCITRLYGWYIVLDFMITMLTIYRKNID